MGCAASTGASGPAAGAGAGAPETRGKKKDVQGTYRERLGEDFMRDFARSHDTILRRMSEPRAGGSPEGSQASAASTLPHDDMRYLSATGTQVSPYPTPPKGSLPAPDQDDSGPSQGPLSGSSVPKDADGPYVCSGKNSRSVSRESSRERLEGQRRSSGGLAGMQRNVPHRLQPLTRQGPGPMNEAPGGPLFF
jgi:hypothetical protein